MRRMTAWKTYWFRPALLAHLAICRIVCVAAQLLLLIQRDVYNHNRLLELSKLPESLYHPLPVLRVLVEPFGWHSPLSFEILLAVYGITLAAGVLALVGFKTNLSLLLFALGNILMQAFSYSFGDFHHAEALMIITLSLLALSPAGRVLSLDDLRRRVRRNHKLQRLEIVNKIAKKSVFAGWPLLVVRYLFGLIYLDAAVQKLIKAGLDWMNGYTVQFYLVTNGIRRGSDLALWLTQYHTLASLLSWVTILFEGTFFLVIFFPRLAWVYIPLGVALHAGMCLTELACFYQFVALYTVFIPWVPLFQDLSERLGFLRPATKPEILFDGSCPLCIRSMTVVRYFDWFDRLRLADLETRWPSLAANYPEIAVEDCRREMHLLLSDGSVRTGFFAFRKILWNLPLLWPLSPMLYLPGASTLGPMLYRWIAGRRLRLQSCRVGTCSSHSANTTARANASFR